MGAKFKIAEAVGDELVKRFGRRLRIVSEDDWKYMKRTVRLVDEMANHSTGENKWTRIDSELVMIRGGSLRKGKR